MNKPLRVLIVEDSEDDVLLTIHALKKGGYSPTFERAENAEVMRNALQKEEWDVILCDYQMPQFNGLAAIALLKQIAGDIPIIIVSGAIGEEMAVECMRSGAHDYIMKDNLSRLVPAIERELREAESRRQRKKTEEALRLAEDNFHRSFDESPLGVRIVSQKGKTTYANRAILDIYGYSSIDELTATPTQKRYTPESLTQFRIRREKRKRGDLLPSEYEISIIRKDSVVRHLQVIRKEILWNGEKQFQVIYQDVTERMRTEENLRTHKVELEMQNEELKQIHQELEISRNRYLDLYDLAPVGYCTVSDTGLILEANLTATTLLGLTRNNLIKQPLSRFIIPEDQDIYYRIIKLHLDIGRHQEGEMRMMRKDGSYFWARIEAVITQDTDGKPLLRIVISDITAGKQAEEEMAKLENQLFQSQKMEAIGTLAGGIAHDFNNILSVIIGYTELARDRSQKENQEQYLQETLKGATRAKNLVKQILTFSRQDDHEKKPLDIKILLKEAVKFLRSSIPTIIEIRQNITAEDCNIMADPTQMHQIIMNLCTNANHAMKEAGGILKIELANVELAQDAIPHHPELKPGHYVKFTVSDTGHGIDPAIVQRIFDPFFTTKSVDEGTGLGLSVVYGIVKGHGGVISVYSEQGKGAAFHVYLPRIIQTEAMEVDMNKPVIGGTERILFVDDEPALVDIGKRMLTSLGYDVTGVLSSADALNMVNNEPQRFDLVITDMTLPKMTGIDLSRKLLHIRMDMPIILCSGIKEPDTEEQAKSLGIKAYLTKPLTKRELAWVIRTVLEKKSEKV